MDIRCERCATEYEIEDERVPDNGLTLKCATCNHVFKVLKPGRGDVSAPPPIFVSPVVTPPFSPPPVVAPAPVPAAATAFALRLYRGGAPIPATCPDMGTLHQWIIEQRLVGADEVSFSGEPWRALSVVPELVPFFALLSVAPPPKPRPAAPPLPSAMTTATPTPWTPQLEISGPHIAVPPAAATLPFPSSNPPVMPGMVAAPAPDPRASFRSALTQQTPPPGKSPFGRARTDDEMTPVYGTPNMPTPLGTPLWNQHIQTFPPLSHQLKDRISGPALELPSLSSLPPAHDPSTAATQQVKLSAEVFAAAEAMRAPPPPVNAPAPSWPPSHAAVASKPPVVPAPTQPAMSLALIGHDTFPDSAGTRAVKANGVSNQTTPIRPMPAITPASSARAKPRAVPRGSTESDPEIHAFVQRGKWLRVIVIAAIVLAAVAVGAYFAFPSLFGGGGPDPEAKASYEKARAIYLAGAMAQFPEAEKELKQAAGKEKGSYPEAEGALAELNTAWAEFLLDQYATMSADLTAKAEGGDNTDAKALLPKVHQLADEAKKKLGDALDEFTASKESQTATPASDRAALDYYRLANDPHQASAAAEALKAQADPESQAHIAAWQALDPKTAAAAEASLKDAVQKLPGFVRARWWLAELHAHAGNAQAALEDMKGILTVTPRQESAMAFVAAAEQKAKIEAAVAAGDQPAAPPAKDQKPKDADLPKEAEKPRETESKALPRLAADEVARRTGGGGDKSSKPVDVDKEMDQASHALEKGKPAKALELYDRVISAKPTLSDALYGKGLALFQMGHTEDSIVAFKKTLEVNHRFGDAMIGIAEAYRRIHDNKSAAKFYQQYLDMYPTGGQAAEARKIVQELK